MPVQNQIQIRRGTSTEWSVSLNPLAQGELGYDTTKKKFKVGDGSSLWDSLSWATITGADFSGVSGINVSYNTSNGTATIAITGLSSSYISDFNSAVSGLLPVKSLFAGTNISVTPTGDKGFIISTNGLDTNTVKDVIGSTIVGVSGIRATYDNVSKVETISVTGLNSSYISDFNSSVSGLLNVKNLVQGSGIGISNNNGIQTISVTGIPSSFITDLGNIATTQVVGRTGISLNYDVPTDTMFIDTTGVALVGHTHTWNSITDASSRATLSELSYLSGVTPGSVSANRALVVDSNKDLVGIRNLTTTGNLIVGGDFSVIGATTTINSTIVNINDNIIRVNTSGLPTGGMEVFDGSTTKSILWNTINNRWEFVGGNVYTSGNFIGNLNGNASTVTNGVYTTDTGTVTSAMIANDTIVNDDINSAAAIAYSKLNLGSSIVNSDIKNDAAISYSKLNLGSSIVNSDVSSSAAINYSKLNLVSGIVNNDINANAAIAYSKLNLGSSIINTDINNSAAISYSKLNLTSGIINTDINASAAIAYSKLNLTSSILNSDIANNAAIVYSKLNLTNSITNNDISSTGAINYSKLNLLSSIVNADISNSASISYSKLNLTSGIINTDISSVAAIAYSKLNLSSSIVNADISNSASIAVNKLSASGMTFGSTIVNLGGSTSVLNGLSSISGTSAANPTTLYYCVIDGGTP